MGASKIHVRSISMPCKSHPNTDRMEKLLNNVKTWESTISSSNPSVDMICSGFSHLTALYECLEDLINTSFSQTSKDNHTMEWADELLDVSVKFLDICSNATDIISHSKQHVRDLGCDLRRNGGCNTESIIAKYMGFRKRVKKEIKGSMSSLKQVDKMIRGCSFMKNYHLIGVFTEITSFTIRIFRFVLQFFAIPSLRRRRTGRWAAVSKFLSKGKVVPEGKLADTTINELQCLDAALLRHCSSGNKEFIQVVPKELEALDASLEGINSHLHILSRRLVVTRVSILNMVSFY